MNDNNLNNNVDNNSDNTYHATTNLNTAIENPQINMGSVTGVNIEENNYFDNNEQNTNEKIEPQAKEDNKISQTNDEETLNFSDYSSENDANFYNTNDNNNYYSYEPILQQKKNNTNAIADIIHSKEAKLMVFIILVLIIFILVIPYIYDFFLGL